MDIKRLFNLRAYEVSYVPVGANGKTFLVIKENGNMPIKVNGKQLLTAVAGLVLKNEEQIVAKMGALSPEDQDALKAALRVLSALQGQVSPETLGELASLAGVGVQQAAPTPDPKMEEEVAKAKEAVTKAQADLAAEQAVTKELRSKLAAVPPAQEIDGFPVTKEGELDLSKIPADSQVIAKAMFAAKRKQDEQLATVNKQLETERDERITKEFVAKAATEYGKLPVKPDELATVLKTITIKAPDVVPVVERILKAAQECIIKSGVLVENGTPGGGDNAAGEVSYEQIEKAALAQPIAKEKGMSTAQAFTHFITKDADGRKLYARYEETRAKKAANG